MTKRLIGRIVYVQASNHGSWFLIIVPKMGRGPKHAGRYFAHSLHVLEGHPVVGASCEFTALPKSEKRGLPRATEMVVFNRSLEELKRGRGRHRDRHQGKGQR